MEAGSANSYFRPNTKDTRGCVMHDRKTACPASIFGGRSAVHRTSAARLADNLRRPRQTIRCSSCTPQRCEDEKQENTMNKLITSTVLAALVAIATSTAFAAPRTTQHTVQPSGAE